VITAVNSENVEHPLDIDFINWGLFIGDKVTLEIDRKGAKHTINFVVEEITAMTS